MGKTNLVVASLVAVAAASFAAVYFGQSVSSTQAPARSAGADVEAGAALYAENCASCHGENLEGEPNWRSAKEDGTLPAPPHDETGHTWHHGDALLFDYTKLGGQGALAASGVADFKSGMPAFGEILEDQEIWNILAYIKSTWPERAREVQEARTATEQEQDGS